jgi:hypothetical protein
MATTQLEKLEKFKNSYLTYNMELVDALKTHVDKLNPEDPKERALIFALLGYEYGIFYKTKALKDFAKEILNYEIEIPSKYANSMKNVMESFTLNSKGELITSDGMSVDELITKLKTLPKDGTAGN